MLFKRKKIKPTLGQSAMELTIFGSVLIFVLGVIISTSVSSNQRQQRQFAASRWAMLASFLSSEGCQDWGGPGGCPMDGPGFGRSPGNASRISSTVLVVEDRLSPESSEFGPFDRVPHMFQGSATHSRNLFYPVDVDEFMSYPMFDLFVNGRHFALWMGQERSISFSKEGAADGGYIWADDCATKEMKDGTVILVGCPLFYSRTFNSRFRSLREMFGFCRSEEESDYWCVDDLGLPINLPIADRFKLKHVGDPVDPALWERFAWQWKAFAGFEPDKHRAVSLNYPYEPLELTDQNSSYDVDGDGLEEKIQQITAVDVNGVITEIKVMDYQEGDVDFTSKHEGTDCDAEPGFTQGLEMYTYLRDGTIAEVRQGQLFGDDNQWISTLKKKNHVDVIRRTFQLNKDTGRFCGPDGPRPDNYPQLLMVENPVEVCCTTVGCNSGGETCYSGSNIRRTCMDTTKCKLHISSRVEDFNGRKWVTDVSQDPYVDLLTPGVP